MVDLLFQSDYEASNDYYRMGKPTNLVVPGHLLEKILKVAPNEFLALAEGASTVLCCRSLWFEEVTLLNTFCELT